jgi:hypothetical protein
LRTALSIPSFSGVKGCEETSAIAKFFLRDYPVRVKTGLYNHALDSAEYVALSVNAKDSYATAKKYGETPITSRMRWVKTCSARTPKSIPPAKSGPSDVI